MDKSHSQSSQKLNEQGRRRNTSGHFEKTNRTIESLANADWPGKPETNPRLIGQVVTRWMADGRRMELLNHVSYVDKEGTVWHAPAGTIFDGASIPRFFWWIIGSPYVGLYREAAVVHDVYCVLEERHWRDVHKMFYDLMIDSGVHKIRAYIMWLAVYFFGPRW
ncbi:MAG: DUF1353 domain-containing protein [Pirellulaceae bacterium]|nr:DUF1353 domain-containing protein [Pirellulaceae bacterium]